MFRTLFVQEARTQLRRNAAVLGLGALLAAGFLVLWWFFARVPVLSPLLQMGMMVCLAGTPLVIGILCGLAMNLLKTAGLVMPEGFWAAVEMIARSALPAALFGLGGVLLRYRPQGDAASIALICGCSLILHPSLTWGLGTAFGLDTGALRSAVVTAAMAPGVNAYLFANLYQAAIRSAASAVLIATALSILTIWGWLAILP